jgi:ubiquinone/menaquinone biosynthesis C-methylase UbiE
MSEDKSLRAVVHKANVEIHQVEAGYYNLIHVEIYNKHEQRRIMSMLKKTDSLILNNSKSVLDFGAGTGNLTGKLLSLGYHVTAVDISAEMCGILKKRYASYLESGKLNVVNSAVENLNFDKNEFDLITCYSVLHHLPNYVGTIQQLSGYLKKGGVMYLDHETPFLWNTPGFGERFVKSTYLRFGYLLNKIYFKVKKIAFPAALYSLDYALSDYWTSKEHHIESEKIEDFFKKNNFDSFCRVDYHLKREWAFNPFFYFYRHFCKPDASLWIARK